MSKFLGKEQYYKITFGMSLDAKRRRFFANEIYVPEGHSSITFYVYAQMEKGTLREVVTGLPIPIRRTKWIPGFGAYAISPVFTIEDLQALSLQMKRISENFYEPYIQALKTKIAKLDAEEEKYRSETSDDIGPLNGFQSHREDALTDSCESEIASINSLVETVSKKLI